MSDKLKVMGAASGALGLGGFAAALGLCCVAPWAVALLGVAGAVAFARLGFLMPYALVGAAACLGLGFWFAYRKPACENGTCNQRPRSTLRIVMWITMLAVLVALLAVGSVYAQASAGSTASGSTVSGYTVIDDGFGNLRDDFNRAKGSIRLLFVVDPICPGCLRGLDDMNRDLLTSTHDARLQTFVVHVPVIGAHAKDVMPAAKLLQNDHVRHYWNPSGAFGRVLADAVQLKNDKKTVYAWDVWLLYGPDAEWTGAQPPQPQLLMHQLWELEGTKFPALDSARFAREVHKRLDALSASSAPQR